MVGQLVTNYSHILWEIVSLSEVRELSKTTRSGSNLLKLSEAAEAIACFEIVPIKTSNLDFHQVFSVFPRCLEREHSDKLYPLAGQTGYTGE